MNKKTRILTISLAILLIIVVGLIWHSQSSLTMKEKEGVKVLAILPLTGPASTSGNYVKNGFTLFKDEFPEARITIKYLDSEGNPAKAVSMLSQSIMQERPDIIISSFSNVSSSIIPKAEMENIFTLITLTTSQNIIKDHKNVQRINPSTEDIVEPIALLAKKRYKKAAVLYVNDDFGLSNKKVFSSLFTDHEHEIILEEGFAIIEKDVKTLVQKIIDTQPEAIYVTGYGPAYIAILQTIKTMNYKVQVFTDIPIGDPFTMNALGDAADGIIFTGTEIELSNPTNQNALDFIEKYKEKFNTPSYCNAVFAYDLMKIIDKFEKDKTKISQESFEKLKSWEGVTVITFIGSGECSIPLFPILRKEGKNVRVD